MIAKFLTLVVCLAGAPHFANASPYLDTPRAEDTQEEPSPPPPPAFENDRLAITPVEEPRNLEEFSRTFSKADYFYPYRQTLSVRAGVLFGLRDSSDEKDVMNGMVGFNYLLPRRKSPQFEIGADLAFADDGQGHINFIRRRIYNERDSFRPYYKLGFMHKFIPKEKFASFSNWENYFAKVAVGFEDIVKPPRSVRLELEAAAGTDDVFVMFTYGYSFGW